MKKILLVLSLFSVILSADILDIIINTKVNGKIERTRIYSIDVEDDKVIHFGTSVLKF